MCGADVRDPVAHGFVDGVLQRTAARVHADNFRAKHSHARNIQALAFHIVSAHIDDALESKPRGDCGSCNAVLPRSGFGYDARLAHAHGKKSLADTIINFVRAGMKQIFALQINARAGKMLRQPRGELQRRWASRKIAQQIIQLGQ